MALLLATSFGGASADDVRAKAKKRLSIMEHWPRESKSRIFLVQNTTDVHHYNIHFKPLWERLGGIVTNGLSTSGDHTAWVYSQEGGHISETQDMASEIVKRVLL